MQFINEARSVQRGPLSQQQPQVLNETAPIAGSRTHRHRTVSRSSSSESLLSEDLSCRARSLFFTLDKDGSGFIEPFELAECCSELSQAELDDLFEKLDNDGDGRISIRDFKEGFRQISQTLFKQRRRCKSRNWSTSDSATPSSHSSLDKEAPPACAHAEGPATPTPRDSLPREKSEEKEDIGDYLDHLDAGFAAMSCQEQVCDLYRSLHGECPQLVQSFEALILDFVRDIRQRQCEHERLEKSYQRDKDIHETRLTIMEEEMESHMKRLEAKIREEVTTRLEGEYCELLATRQREVEDLTERIRSLQDTTKDEQGEESVAYLKAQLAAAEHENRFLKSDLTESATQLALTRGDMKALRNELAERSKELHQNKLLVMDYVKEQDKLQHQLGLLREANRKLHDTNDDLRSALEDYSQRSVNSIHQHSAPVSRQTSNISRTSEPTLSVCDPVFNKRDQLLPAHDICEIDSLPDDMDSGLSTLRDITEVESEVDVRVPSVVVPSRTQRARQLKPISSDSDDYDPKESEFETETDRRKKYLGAEMAVRPESLLHLESDSGREGGSRRSPNRRGVTRRNLRTRKTVTCRSRSRNTAQVDTVPSPTGPPERMFKVVLCGDAAVGKTSFIMRLCKDKFVGNMTSTLGVDFHPKTIAVDGRVFSLQLWDTAGQERFRSLAKSYFRKVDGVLLLYDCTYERSFLNVRDWMCTIQEEADKGIPVMIVGNKTDMRDEFLAENKKVVTEFDGKRLAQEYEALFIETSAKRGDNTLEAVTELARLMRTQQDYQVKSVNVHLTAEKPKNSNACCNI